MASQILPSEAFVLDLGLILEKSCIEKTVHSVRIRSQFIGESTVNGGDRKHRLPRKPRNGHAYEAQGHTRPLFTEASVFRH